MGGKTAFGGKAILFWRFRNCRNSSVIEEE